MNTRNVPKKILYLNLIKVILLVGLFVLSPSDLLAQKCYTPEGSTVEQCAESETAEIAAALSVPNSTETANPAPCEGGFLSYQTLVKIPGLGKQNASGTNVVDICANSLGQYLQVGFNYFIGVAIALAVVMIIYGGVLYATTEAVYGKSDAKNTIMSAVQGLALALGSWLILYTINPDLLKFQLDIGTLKLQGSTEGGRGAAVEALQVIQNGDGAGVSGAVTSAEGIERETLLLSAARAAGITNKNELAGLMGNAKYETANFRFFTEINGDRKRYAPYYGRGYFQLTHRANYAEYGRILGVNLVNNPELASGKSLSARISVEYWKRRVTRFNPTTNLEAGGLGINGNEKRLYPRRWANRQAAVRSYLSDPRL